MDDAIIARIGERIRKAQVIGLAAHKRPDGDAVGALLGLGAALRAAGKTTRMLLSDGVPSNFRHLPGASEVVRKNHTPVDLTIVLDCADLPRSGDVFQDHTIDINIDHHITNTNFAQLNLVDPGAVATCEMLTRVIPMWGLTITSEAAACLLSGILADTIGFRTPNTNAATLRMAADLIDLGANMAELYHRALIGRTFEGSRYWGEGLRKLEHHDKIVWTSLTMADRKASNYHGNDDADLVNMVSAINGAEIAIGFVEQQDELIKVSWRAQPGWDVSEIAAKYGGGGHPAAAGAMIQGTLEQVMESVLKSTRKITQDTGMVDGQGRNI
jgi:phosphoesterase RecJ-like protein